ncbi:sensor domain-containing diguanylate cyclase [Bradyrhizobium guangzhouense]|uniref:diguanylate cyclase n=1 Tax=Bradyrhizobium guangzhouense TaxID=1325095 RepID=A0AAE5WWQ8_9BRAD|nr:GGDEF domain-containing protein [Bradyrhizobium guangzhouense]QAU44534.1 GGDEF domain-containing protein [Bradyrhizobium guangzhouense]RXH12667.1 diguanylate cyclase [Bradyrhizobium guangzhouense]
MSRLVTERTFLAGKIFFNFGQSSIDCVVRRLSEEAATLEMESGLGVPERFQLRLAGRETLACRVIWRSDRQVGVAFEQPGSEQATGEERDRSSDALMRAQMLALRAALDHVPTGIVLLDADLRARLINRSFREMWHLPDQVADSNPSILTLLHHGRDIGAYEVPDPALEAHVIERVRVIEAGDPTPIDVRRTNGDVVRVQCTPLPDGGRMLTYTPVTDIVRSSDELKLLRDALENVQDGVLLLDSDLNASFMNLRMRRFWEVSEEEAARRPAYAALVSRVQRASAPDLAASELAKFPGKRVAEVIAGDHVRDLQTPDGRRIRAHCTTMSNGGRMLTYVDITDLTNKAAMLERLATTDPLTSLYNRRHFLGALDAEWSRFQRYYRSVSVLMLDIDHFKSVNDRYGHAVGDEAIKAVAAACNEGKRKSDLVGRIGGEEFAVLLPETSLSRARLVAERIRKRAMAIRLKAHQAQFGVTVSIGIAEATVSMSGIDALMGAADQALYQAKNEGRNRCIAFAPPRPASKAAE